MTAFTHWLNHLANQVKQTHQGTQFAMKPPVFISYSHQDEVWKDRILGHLNVLVKEDKLVVWEDRQIQPGQIWLSAIEQAMDSCRVAVLLISKDFLSSDFIQRQEVPTLLRRREAEGVRVIPVILKPCVWQEVDWLQGIQARPKDGKALSGMSEHDADAAMTDLVLEIHRLLSATPKSRRASAAVVQPAAVILPPPVPPQRQFPKLPRKLFFALPAVAIIAVIWVPVSAWLREAMTQPPRAAEAGQHSPAPQQENSVPQAPSPTQTTTPPPTAASKPPAQPSSAIKEPAMVALDGGEFWMGSDKTSDPEAYGDETPRHKVKVEPFSLGKFEVTVAEYAAFAAAPDKGFAVSDAWRKPGFTQGDNHPAVNVSFHEAQAYAAWLVKQTGKPYRLPTEAEWEYAARAGTETSRYWGNNLNDACAYANVYNRSGKLALKDAGDVACEDHYVHTAPVGQFKPNAWGLHDMLGNAWEWTCSAYAKPYNGAESRCDESAVGRVLRGGSGVSPGGYAHSVRAAQVRARLPGHNIGFRLALGPTSPASR
jgi:formylglycine-generating enzyme required for sulfatase activity